MHIYNSKMPVVTFGIFSIAVFILIQLIVSRKKFHTLKNFYLLAAVISISSLLFIIRLVLISGQNLIIKLIPYFESDKGGIIASIILYAALLLSILVFLFIFGIITKRKSEYVSYISKEVSEIANNGEDIHIEEKGNDELTVLSISINQMNSDLLENRKKQIIIETQKNELISNVSHDLRSPLTSIIGYLHLLKEYSDKNDDKFSEYIEVTDRRLKDLNKLINELFELTKMDSPDFHLKLEQGDVTAFIKQFSYEMTDLLKQKGLNLIFSIDNSEFIMDVDFDRLARVMQNIFSNVMKYAVPYTDVLLESNASDNILCISLSNSISPEQIIDPEIMFDRFYRDDQARSDNSSSGLGLAIAKKIIELHGGNISAKIDDNIITIKICFGRK